MSSSYRNSLNEWLSQLDVKANRVLDIGGSQESVKGRTRSWNVKEYLIADLDDPHKGAEPDLVLDMNKPFVGNEKFDLVFCLEVFEYVYDPLTAFKNLQKVLDLGGSAWVSFPSFYPTHQPIDDDSLRYMEGGIMKLALASGLGIKQMIRRRPEFDALQQFFSVERLRAAKGYDHDFLGFIVEFTNGA